MTKQHILIAQPTYRGVIDSQTHKSVIAMGSYFAQRRVAVEAKDIDTVGIDIARNVFGSYILQEKRFSHVLFLDSDMVPTPQQIGRLLDADKPLIGWICPQRHIDLEAFYQAAKTHSFKAALAMAHSFGIGIEDDSEPATNTDFVNGVGRVHSLGMAVTLIKREVFERMAATEKLRTPKFDGARTGLTSTYYEFFEQIRTERRSVSEDLSFCERWRELCDGEVWAIGDEAVGHIGHHKFSAAYLDQFIP